MLLIVNGKFKSIHTNEKVAFTSRFGRSRSEFEEAELKSNSAVLRAANRSEEFNRVNKVAFGRSYPG